MAVDSKQLIGEVDQSIEWTDEQMALLLKGFLDALIKEQNISEKTA